MLLTLAAFFFAIGLLVTVHEYGHYRAAKHFGVRVLTFSIGFGKPLLQWRVGETQWQIAAVPLGGFVRMLGEDDEQALSDEDACRAFNRQSPLRRMAIVAAGPLANLVLAWLLFSAALMVGIDALKPIAGSVQPGSVAALAGLRSGDEILRFGDIDVADWDDLRLAALTHGAGKPSLMVHAPEGGERELTLDLASLGAEAVDAAILARIGLSPVPLLNRISAVEPGSVAERAGLQPGDQVLSLDDVPVNRWERLQELVSQHPGREVALQVLRNGEMLVVRLTPQRVETPQGVIGRIGVAPQVDDNQFSRQKFVLQLGGFDALAKGADKAWVLSRMTLEMIGRMLTGGISSRHVSGPIGIAGMAGESASLGVAAYLQYLALVSLSLGILNLLPVPVLDGGHLLYHSAELVRGRPLPASWQSIGQRIGVALLVGMMLLALYNDIHRFIPGQG